MPLSPPLPEQRAALALAARSLAWTLMIAGWLVLGALGLRHAPVGVAAWAPVALWLLTLGLATHVSASPRASPQALRAVLVGSAAMVTLSLAVLAHGVPLALWPAAAAWGVLLVAASRVVRGWRRQSGPRLPSPVAPACLGAIAAWALAGDPQAVAAQPMDLGWAVLAAGIALAWMVPPAADDRHGALGCRGGLFDCALSWPTLAQWREPAHWPWIAASLAMLPMMTSLPLMAEGCARAGWPVHAVSGLHLFAMLAPAAIVARSRSATLARRLPALVAVAMVSGGVAALALPAADGTMVAMALHAVAWGLAWAGAMAPATPGGAGLPAARGGPAVSALASAAAVTALGLLVAHDGLAAWSGVHVALAALAALGSVAAWHRPRLAFEEQRG
jgi:hypothetical protein